MDHHLEIIAGVLYNWDCASGVPARMWAGRQPTFLRAHGGWANWLDVADDVLQTFSTPTPSEDAAFSSLATW